MNHIVIDGSYGEGGGQLLRYAAALSVVLGTSLEVRNIRLGRSVPGLRPQHLCVLRSLCILSNGRLVSDEVGSTKIEFMPKNVVSGCYKLEVGTAGSATLVLEALLLACVNCPGRFVFEITGGSDVLWSPGWDYFCNVFVVVLRRMGMQIKCELLRRGYYPKGGGKMRLTCVVPDRLTFLSLKQKQNYDSFEGIVHGWGVDSHIFKRISHSISKDAFKNNLKSNVAIQVSESDSVGVGVSLWSHGSSGGVVGSSLVGRRGLPAETVAKTVFDDIYLEMKGGFGVDYRCFDQILPFLAVASGNSELVVRKLSNHAKSALWLIERFVGHCCVLDEKKDNSVSIKIKGQL